jgi:hypothetical protein
MSVLGSSQAVETYLRYSRHLPITHINIWNLQTHSVNIQQNSDFVLSLYTYLQLECLKGYLLNSQRRSTNTITLTLTRDRVVAAIKTNELKQRKGADKICTPNFYFDLTR